MAQFSESTNNTGIVQQVRDMARVDSTQWPTSRIVNSTNNWLDKVTGYAIGADRRFQWDDTNHTELPEGKRDLTISVTDYSFLTDEQGNTILTLTKVELLSGGYYTPLEPVDKNDENYDETSFGQVSGSPSQYDKIADNIIRLDKIPTATVTNGLRFTFQRTPSYFAATDTTKSPGVAPILHRGFVIAGAYDCSLTLGLQNLQPLSIEMAKEEQFMKDYFGNRGMDNLQIITPSSISFR
jgi:hypothetical protein